MIEKRKTFSILNIVTKFKVEPFGKVQRGTQGEMKTYHDEVVRVFKFKNYIRYRSI